MQRLECNGTLQRRRHLCDNYNRTIVNQEVSRDTRSTDNDSSCTYLPAPVGKNAVASPITIISCSKQAEEWMYRRMSGLPATATAPLLDRHGMVAEWLISSALGDGAFSRAKFGDWTVPCTAPPPPCLY
mmetsp:Transcript_38449/g.78485  ORF Transcript_38449/g.78485 Transcript_38449/m.78485 type:complete len:129 (-) Transcript_38449:2510-2896(-)